MARFWWRLGAYRADLSEKLLEAAPVSERAKAGSKNSPSLAKAETITDGDNVSGAACLKRGKKSYCTEIIADKEGHI